MDKKLLGKQIKQIRLMRGLSQEKLSEMVDISPRQMCVIENGSSIPSLDTFVKIAKTLQIDVNEFFNINYTAIDETRADIIELVKAIDVKRLSLLKDLVKALNQNR